MAEVLIVGNGGREDAIVQAIQESEGFDDGQIYVTAPNDAGMLAARRVISAPMLPTDTDRIVDFASARADDLLVVIGPEQPLAMGLADELRLAGVATYGPSQEAAKLETSKIAAVEFMEGEGIVVPEWEAVYAPEDGVAAIRKMGGWQNVVIKGDGLGSGKSVILPKSQQEAVEALQDLLVGHKYDGSGDTGVLIQRRLHGPEVSVFVVSDGENFSIIPYFAQDHKRLEDDDKGPNTGGMGAYTPLPEDMLNDDQLAKIKDIAARTINGMNDRGVPYNGTLYIGLLLAEEFDGDPVPLEYNARFGDPEAQVVLPMLTDAGLDVYGMFHDTAHGQVPSFKGLQLAGRAALTVCLASAGYPVSARKGDLIHGLDGEYPNVQIFHGGTRREAGQVFTNGGRVLYVTGKGQTVDEAAAAAYGAIGEDGVHFDGMHRRRDIGKEAIARLGRRS